LEKGSGELSKGIGELEKCSGGLEKRHSELEKRSGVLEKGVGNLVKRSGKLEVCKVMQLSANFLQQSANPFPLFPDLIRFYAGMQLERCGKILVLCGKKLVKYPVKLAKPSVQLESSLVFLVKCSVQLSEHGVHPPKNGGQLARKNPSEGWTSDGERFNPPPPGSPTLRRGTAEVT
jgi:hypothetical protein